MLNFSNDFFFFVYKNTNDAMGCNKVLSPYNVHDVYTGIMLLIKKRITYMYRYASSRTDARDNCGVLVFGVSFVCHQSLNQLTVLVLKFKMR